MNKTIPTLGFFDAITQAANNIVKFNGRARRSEYWWVKLMVILFGIFLTPVSGFILDLVTIPLTFRRLHDTGRSGWWWGAGALLKVGFIVFLIAEIIMVGIDVANSMFVGCGLPFVWTFLAKYTIWALLILAYNVMMLVFMCMDSEPYENEYGESPKYVDDDEEL